MLKRTVINCRTYRERLKSVGKREILLRLDGETVDAIDRLREQSGARSRSTVAETLIAKALLEAGIELKTT